MSKYKEQQLTYEQREMAGEYTRIHLNQLSFKIHDLEIAGDFDTAKKLHDLLGIAKTDSFSLSDVEIQKHVIAEYPQKIRDFRRIFK
jgi:hypothetical protein